MHLRRWTFSLSAVLLAVFGLAACGGGGGGGDEDQIREAIVDFATGQSNACDLITDDLVKKQFDDRDGCEKALKDTDEGENAKKSEVDINNVDVNGSKATVKAEVKGDASVVTLVKEAGDWKIDSIGDDESASEDSTTDTTATASITKEEFVSKTEDICDSAKAKSDDLEKELDDLKEGDTAGLADLLSRLAAVFRDDLKKPIDELGIPEGDAAAVGRIDGTLDVLIEQTSKTGEAADGGDTTAIQTEVAAAQSAQKSAKQAFDAYGIECNFATG